MINIPWGQEFSPGPMYWTWLSHLGGSGPIPGQSTKPHKLHGMEEKGKEKEREKKKKKKTNRQTKPQDKW